MDNILLGPSISKHDKPKKLMVMLHGYGDNAANFIHLAEPLDQDEWGMHYVALNAPSIMPGNPMGYQWFDLTKDDPNYIIEQSIKAENKLNKFICQIKEEYNLENNKICLSGFSQGCMMSINLGLTSNQSYNCVVGFSGKIINQKNLQKRKKALTNILLIHGDSDQVVSPNFMLEAKDFFIRNNVEIETHLIKNCDHHIPIEASSKALNYILKKI